MPNGHGFIDSDAHIIEPEDMFEKYLDSRYRSAMPKAWANYRGEPLGFGFEVRIPNPDGGEYLMPFGRDPLRNPAQADGKPHSGAQEAGERVFLPGHDEAYAAYAKQDFPPEIYPEVMQRVGIDYMVVYPSIGLLSVTVPKLAADTAAAYRRAYNNWLADFCAAAGGRVFGAASIDLRDAQEAAREVRRCVTQFHFKAVHINPVPVCEHRLYDEFYEPLWETLEELDVPLAVHTGNGTAADEMLYYYLPRLRSAQTTVAFTIGNMLASTALIMGGVLERHPKLRVVHLESGAGWAAFWLDRLGAGVQGGFRGLAIEGLSMPPVEYFKRQCYISADPDDPGIRQVIDAIGDNNIVTATDFAHPEGRQYAWAVKEMMALPGVSDDSKRKIMWDNALRLYPIQPDE